MFYKKSAIGKEFPVGQNDSPTENRKFATVLRLDREFEPTHAKVLLPPVDSGVARFGRLQESFWAYEHFEGYADYVHRFAEIDSAFAMGPWRIERRAEPELLLSSYLEGPNYGIRYKVYYNGIEIGDLEIDPHGVDEEDDHQARCCVTINIHPAPFIKHEHIQSFLCVCSEPFGDRDRIINVTGSLQNVLWEVNRLGSQWVSLDFGYCGSVDLRRPFKSK